MLCPGKQKFPWNLLPKIQQNATKQPPYNDGKLLQNCQGPTKIAPETWGVFTVSFLKFLCKHHFMPSTVYDFFSSHIEGCSVRLYFEKVIFQSISSSYMCTLLYVYLYISFFFLKAKYISSGRTEVNQIFNYELIIIC